VFTDNAWDLAGALARQWFRDQCAAPFEPLYVFYRPSDGARPGDVVIARAAPDAEYQQAGAVIASSCSREQALHRIHNIVEPLPILPTVGPVEPPQRRSGAARNGGKP